MPEPTSPIDLSVVDALAEICTQRLRLEGYRARVEQRKATVDPTVYARVTADYVQRQTALEAQAAPLQSRAREEYGRLQTLSGSVREASDMARLIKEELELRHAVGEFTDQELAQRLVEPEQQLEAHRIRLAELDAQQARFLEVLPEPDEDHAEAVAVATKGHKPEKAEKGEKGEKGATREVKTGSQAVTMMTLPELTDNDATQVVQDGLVTPPPFGKGAKRVVAETDGDETRTFELPSGLLVFQEQGRQREFVLGPVNDIGRSEENSLQFVKPGVSRKHAVVAASEGGFLIRDLQSQNGTFVNDEPVTERRLADGDRIAIGHVALVFRQPASVSAPRRSSSRPSTSTVSDSRAGDQRKRAARGRS